MAGYPATDQSGGNGDNLSSRTFDTSPIYRLIRTTRRLLRSTWFLTGLFVSVGMLLSTVVLVSLTDLVIPLYPTFRLLGLLTIVAPTLWLVFVGVIRPLSRRLTAALVARRIEREIPGIHNRLVSCVDLAGNGHSERVSKAFHERLIQEAVERIRNFNPRSVLDLLTLRRAAVFAVVSGVAFVLAFSLLSDRMPTAMARILQPFADIPPASSVNFHVLVGSQTAPGDYETLRGEDLDFTVVLNRGQVDPPGSENALKLRVDTVDENGAAKTIWHDFAALQAGRTTFQLAGMQRSFEYRVHGGGTWTKKYRVTMLDRPRIVGLQTALYYPEYMRISEPRLGLLQSRDVTGPKESRVSITVTVEGDAHEGEIQLLQPTRIKEHVADRTERVWFSDALPPGAKAEGKWKWDEKLAGVRAHFDAAANAAHAHGLSGAPIGFEVRQNDNIFAYVMIPEDEKPEAIMLKFHDGQDWEQRAFWGADKIAEGTLGSPSRQRIGDLPEVGKLVRLEIPAELIEMAGRQIYGVSFTQFGGRAVWGAVGALPAAQREVTKLTVVESFLLTPVDSDNPSNPAAADGAADDGAAKWRGEFRLLRDGYYRVEVRNRIGSPNQQMLEGKLQAILDEPPRVVVDRPGVNLIVSKPINVPLFFSAYDDYGVEEIVLSIKTSEDGGFQGRPIRRFDQPQRSAQSTATIDLAKEGLKIGDTLFYRVEVRDAKGQSATTEDYTVRLAEEATAADKQFAQYEQQTEAFQEELVELIEEQQKVQQQVQALTEKSKPLTEEIKQAKAEAAKAVEETIPAAPPKDPAETTQVELTPEAVKQLADLRGQLSDLAKQEDQNVQRAQKVAGDLQKLAEQSTQQQFVPPEVAEQLQIVQKAFQQMALDPLQQLSTSMKQSAQPQQQDPQLPQIEAQAEQLRQNLEDLKNRVEAVAKAQKGSRINVDQSLVDLRNNLMKQDAAMASRDLTELADYLEAMKKELNSLKGDQEGLLEDSSKDLSDRLFDLLEQDQEQLDEQSDEALNDAANLLDQLRKMNRPSDQQDGDDPPEEQAKGETPAEGEQNEPQEKEAKQAQAAEKAKEAEPEMLLPSLGGPPPKVDPKFAERIREILERGKQNGKGERADERKELRSRQADQLQELDLAEQAIGSDQRSLERMLDQFSRVTQGQVTAEEAAEVMKAEELQKAMSMLQRMKQLDGLVQDQNSQPQQDQPQLPKPSQNPLSNLNDAPDGVEAILVELDEVDVNTRTIIMKMQPRTREDLLQALREEGPEGYRSFIRDYFRRLTEAQGNN